MLCAGWYFFIPNKNDILCHNQFIDSVPEMASSDSQDWLMLRHPGIFEKIMLMIGLDSIESLDICRQVCRAWNTMILNLIWENPTKKWGTIIQRRIEKCWENLFPSGEKISHAKYLGKTQNQNIIDCPIIL